MDCNCGAGNDAYLARHADNCALRQQSLRHESGTPSRPFCDGCDHGVVAGHVCESCGGTGYAERREGDRRKTPATTTTYAESEESHTSTYKKAVDKFCEGAKTADDIRTDIATIDNQITELQQRILALLLERDGLLDALKALGEK